ncbi:MAG: NAD-dependent epimerase/dehydratase family protein [Chloroflexi bacterium]|nr:MAG: NAD-dependent epimerase/dehydratase family protein [Chloroflexota bacterium]
MDLKNQTVLVTGATGFLGSALVKRLSIEGGKKIKALVRRPERAKFIHDLDGVELVFGDITNAAHIQNVMPGCDVVFHVAAALGGNLTHQYAVNVQGTRHLVEAAVRAGVKRFVHVSTISVYGYRNRTDVTESTPYDPGADPYHITKVMAEKTLIDYAADMPYTIIRPGMIYGPRSQMWTKTMFKLVRKRVFFIGDGSGSAYPIYVDDVVDLMLTLAHHPAAIGEAFNCTPDPSPTWREFLSGYAQLAGHDRWISLPPVMFRAFALIVSALAPKNSQAKDLNDLIPFLTNYITYKMDKARDLLGWQPKVTLNEGIQNCVPYLKEKGLL